MRPRYFGSFWIAGRIGSCYKPTSFFENGETSGDVPVDVSVQSLQTLLRHTIPNNHLPTRYLKSPWRHRQDPMLRYSSQLGVRSRDLITYLPKLRTP
jgi:hypothetical protein